MRKLLNGILIFVLVVAMVGCSGGTSENNTTTTDEKVEIVYVNEGEREPINPDDTTINKDKKLTATFVIDTRTILDNMDKLNKDKKDIVPSDGYILGPMKVEFYEGENVYDVLQRELRARKMQMESMTSPLDNSIFIEGINNIYKLDCGEQSGWMFKVNKWFPYYGYNRYVLKENDVVEIVYTCNFGEDVGFVMDTGDSNAN